MVMSDFVHRLFWSFLSHTCKWWPDTLWLKMFYRTRYKRSLYIKAPKSFNEKLNLLKVYDINPLYVKM